MAVRLQWSSMSETRTMRTNAQPGKVRGFGLARNTETNSGFSLLEMVMAMSIILILTGISFMTYPKVLAQTRLTNAFNTTLTTMRRAREKAIAERRIYTVTFAAPGTLTVTQAATGTVISTATLPPDVSFTTQTGFPNPGPDGFGTGVNTFDFDINVAGGNGNPIYFYPDGSGRDLNGAVNNGVVYLARPGDLSSSRAISMWGDTGRLKGWRLSPNALGVYAWGQQ